MSDDTPFLRTILDHPHDSGPRLVFADWLEERGDPWGELIRLQCELATTYQEDKTDDYFRLQPPFFTDPVGRMIERCGRLLDTQTPMILQRMFDAAIPGGITVVNRWQAVDGDLIWWRNSAWGGRNNVRLFFWRGMPERLVMTAVQWLELYHQYMETFPIWYLRLNVRASSRESWSPMEDVLHAVSQYAGRMITTLDVPNWMPANAFTAWTCNILDAIGEKCHAVTGQPFTLRIGQAVMAGPPHSAVKRWQAYCDRWLRDSNVRIVSRLEARPAGEAMPGGVTTRGTNDER